MARPRTPKPKEYPAGSMHSSGGWEGQIARTSRWLARLQAATSLPDAEDFLYAFFQNCFHLHEWLPADQDQGEIARLLKDHLVMRICRDIANMTKHRDLTLEPSQGHQPSVLREYVGPGKGWLHDDSRLVVVTNHDDDGIVLDAREVAKECLRLWCEFLPNCGVVQQIKSHYAFSSASFARELSKGKARTAWAKTLAPPILALSKTRGAKPA